MKTFEFNDDQIAVILNTLYSRHDILEEGIKTFKNPLYIESTKNQFEELKKVIEIFEKDN